MDPSNALVYLLHPDWNDSSRPSVELLNKAIDDGLYFDTIPPKQGHLVQCF